MQESNIIGGSNIYPCCGIPTQDPSFMNNVQDYELLKELYDKNVFSCGKIVFTNKQKQIIETDMRCVYAKNDPCWGYVDGKGIVSKCINVACPQIKKCNKEFAAEDEKEWRISFLEKNQYGCPDKQKKYYLVDLVSDYEKEQYVSNPKAAGIEYPPIKDKVKKERKMIIIGYERTRFSDYCDEQMSPIWGYADSTEGSDVRKSKTLYGSTNIIKAPERKIKDVKKSLIKGFVQPQKKSVEIKITKEFFDKKALEKNLKKKLNGEIKLTDIYEEMLVQLSEDRPILMVFDNPAELSYISSMLIKTDIDHDIWYELQNESKIVLCDILHLPDNISGQYILLSDSLLKNGCSDDNWKNWKKLSDQNELVTLTIPSRDYFSFVCKNGKTKWGCRNLYGATHICLNPEELILNDLEMGNYKVTLVNDSLNKTYQIIDTYSEELLGNTNQEFFDAIQQLKGMEEIINNPSFIAGIVLKISGEKTSVFGIGHMKFDEY